MYISMFLTGGHKVGLMGLVLVPSSTLKTEMEIRNKSTKGQKGGFQSEYNKGV